MNMNTPSHIMLRVLVAVVGPGAVLLTPIAGCGETPMRMTPDAVDEDDGSPGEGDSGDGVVSFSKDVLPLLVDRCSVCHVEGGIADVQGIPVRLDQARAYDQIVNKPSVQGDFTLVVPGDAEASLVYQKIDAGIPPVGARMPLGGPFLDADSIEAIEDWINQGALDN
jgi:hypothetical protein